MIVTILLLQKSNVASRQIAKSQKWESLELFLIGNMIIYFTRRIRRTHYSFM